MQDRQLLLGIRDYAGKGKKLSIGLLVLDETKPFVVSPLAEAAGSFVQLRVGCIQPDGTQRNFDILAGESPIAAVGVDKIGFSVAMIQVSNVGSVGGTLYIRVTNDVGTELYYKEGFVVVGEVLMNALVQFAMPNRDYGITVECGHL